MSETNGELNSQPIDQSSGVPSRAERLIKPLVGIVVPVATLALLVGPILLAWNDLPRPMATGWGGDGAARTPADPTTFLAVQATVAVFCGVLFGLGGLRRFATPIYNGTAAVIAASIAPTMAVVSVSTVAANRGLADWRDATDPGLVWMAAAIVLPFVGIAAVGWLMRSTFLSRNDDLIETPSAGLSITETGAAAWHSQASAGWPRLVGVPLVVVGVITSVIGTVMVGPQSLVLGLSCLVAGISALAFSSIEVSVDRRGLTVRYGPAALAKEPRCIEFDKDRQLHRRPPRRAWGLGLPGESPTARQSGRRDPPRRWHSGRPDRWNRIRGHRRQRRPGSRCAERSAGGSRVMALRPLDTARAIRRPPESGGCEIQPAAIGRRLMIE